MSQNHILILKVFDELKFNLGKKTLVDFLKGDINNTIEKNNLDELNSYGCLYFLSQFELFNLIDRLIENHLLESKMIMGSYFVICRTSLGTKEIYQKKFNFDLENSPSLNKNYQILFDLKEDPVTNEDLNLFEKFDFFLKFYNQEQKKAIISNFKNILCIAGAGTGKTTVLTKRIEFLVKFRSISQEKILAITFTKKAKEEMKKRLEYLKIYNVKIETFNSFCEKMLKKYSEQYYGKNVRVITYGEKIKIIREALSSLGITFDLLVEDYFSSRQIKEKNIEELFFSFVNDIFSILDFYKNYQIGVGEFYKKEKNYTKKRIAKNVYDILLYIEVELKKKGLRDFSDQILDALDLFKKFPNYIVDFEHILVDEFQDVNYTQLELIKILKTNNLFVVGDPRQAIYGWRGSQVEYILNFPKYFENTQIISLKKNYRSGKKIIDLFNLSIKQMKLLNLESTHQTWDGEIFLVEHDNDLLEQVFVIEAIKNSKNDKSEIFILARTNKILEGFADMLEKQSIPFSIKLENDYKLGNENSGVTLATIHSIKGMEAKEVYIVGTNTSSFPNKVQDNFIFSLVKDEIEYNKDLEELRLFYVALSRAKEKLVITYTGSYSKFITDEMLELVSYKGKKNNVFSEKKPLSSYISNINSGSTGLKNSLKDWRAEIARKTGLPIYMIISNQTIEQLILKMPQQKAELYDISGLGPTKILKYGDEILKILNG